MASKRGRCWVRLGRVSVFGPLLSVSIVLLGLGLWATTADMAMALCIMAGTVLGCAGATVQVTE